MGLFLGSGVVLDRHSERRIMERSGIARIMHPPHLHHANMQHSPQITSIMLFRSRLCDVCTTTLRLAFADLQEKERDSDQVPHHIMKESLIDSILHRSCHLCRLIIYHLKLHWASKHWQDKDDDTELPHTLTEDDFKDSDFEFASFASDRRIVRSYMRGLPETLNLHATISRYQAGEKGVFGLAVIDCDALNLEDVNAAMTRLWVFDKDGGWSVL